MIVSIICLTTVYARSTQAFSGGFSGNEPAIAQATRDAAVSEIRGHLQDTIQKKAALNGRKPLKTLLHLLDQEERFLKMVPHYTLIRFLQR